MKVQSLPQQLQHISVNAAGIDIGAEQHWVAVPEGRDEVSVRAFNAFTADLMELADWLDTMWRDQRGHGIDRRLLDPAVRVAGEAGVRG